jgi:Arc/MetJ family transcription regulator
MRTNIVLDDELLRRAQKFTSARTKRGVIDEALRTFVDVKEREMLGASLRERLAGLRRQLAGRQLGPTSVELIRRDRDSR